MGILACAGLFAQGISTVKVGTSVEGPYFYVDGQQYTSTQIFLWPTGSKHIVQFPLSVAPTGDELPYQAGNNSNVRYSFTGWKTNGPNIAPNGSTTQVITADATVTEVIGQITANFLVHVQFYQGAIGDGNCQGAHGDPAQDGERNGIIYIDGTCFGNTTDVYLAAGEHKLNAFPFPGYVFNGWMIGGHALDPYLSTFTLTGGTQIIPQFMPAKRVRFSSNPAGLKILVDGTLVPLPSGQPKDQLPSSNFSSYCTPDYSKLPVGAPSGIAPLCMGDFDFLPGSQHRIGAPQSQKDDAGLWWVFSGFSNGLKSNDIYVPDGLTATPAYITANFVPGIPATFLTTPGGLKLEVDGRQNWPGYNFIWGAGEQHRVSAPATQTDSRGRKYVFVGWSNDGTAEQFVTVPNDRFGMTLTAKYQILGQVRVTSQPPGINVTVDGADCKTPCTFDRESGSQMTVQAPPTVPASFLQRYDFDNWDGQATSLLPVTFNTDVQVIRANYHTSYLLAANSDPVGQVAFDFSPSSADGYFADGTRVTVTAKPKGGYKFRRWDGDLTGTFATGYLTMSSPREVIARLDKVPFIPEAGLKNAAGETPGKTVAPGSIAAIYGENLADALVIGPTNPLSQTLGGLTVVVNDRLLPLLFVSPKQINVQIPSDLPDGVYTAKVKAIGHPDVGVDFTVRRNSPGLFTNPAPDGSPIALALHEDGTPVSIDSPARRKETISLFGTGFGPYEKRVIDGFIVPADAVYRLVDSAQLVSGDLTFAPQFTGAAPGMVGTAVMRLKITDDMPSAAKIDVTVSVNGAQSNSTQLPLE
jgi:uncharacterized protein (TIGR03437 family)